MCDENEGDWLLRPARVLPLDGFQEASGGDYSDDVFLCEYLYNKGFQVMHQVAAHTRAPVAQCVRLQSSGTMSTDVVTQLRICIE